MVYEYLVNNAYYFMKYQQLFYRVYVEGDKFIFFLVDTNSI